MTDHAIEAVDGERDVVLASGQGHLDGEIFCVASAGALSDEQVLRGVEAVGEAMRDVGVKVSVHSGVDAARDVLDRGQESPADAGSAVPQCPRRSDRSSTNTRPLWSGTCFDANQNSYCSVWASPQREDTMSQRVAEDILAYCRSELGEDLRAVTYYSPDNHDPIYTRQDGPDQLQFDEETRGMFRFPLVRWQKAVRELADHHPVLDDPVFSTCSYQNVLVVQFPITREEGVIVMVDSETDLPEDFESSFKSILGGSEGTLPS